MAEDLTHPAGSVETAAPEPAAPPESLPGYELIDEIGHGGMGVVYRARDVTLDRDVAVKLLSQRYQPIRSLPSASSARHASADSCSIRASPPCIRSAHSPMAGPFWP